MHHAVILTAFVAAVTTASVVRAQQTAAAPPAATVVFESGLGDGADVWKETIRRLGDSVRAFSYGRPGYDHTPASGTPRDPCTIARELRLRLEAAGHRPPFVVVGHSLGGQYAYAFARLYPEETAGLLLVDATPPGHWAALQRDMPGSARLLRVMKAVTFSRTMRREFDDQDRCLDTLRTSPLGVRTRLLVRTRDASAGGAQLMQIDRELARQWVTLTGAASLEPMEDSGHYIQRDQPERLVKIIRTLVDSAGH